MVLADFTAEAGDFLEYFRRRLVMNDTLAQRDGSRVVTDQGGHVRDDRAAHRQHALGLVVHC